MSRSRSLTIFFSAGEPSGDLHGANLIRQLCSRAPVRAVGYGGPEMAAAGCELHADLTALAVMWIARALINLHKFWALLGRAEQFFREQRPDAVVLIDYPGFNWWIARRAKACGIPVFYYTPPQIWAWAPWRVKKMRRFVDHVLCALPFEEPWFSRRGCRATYIGHPFFDEVRRQQPDEAFMGRMRGQRGPLVVILPGSRTQEVTANLPSMLRAAELVRNSVPDVRFAIAAFKPQQAEMAWRMVAASGTSAEVHAGKAPELMRVADCCMAVSGSVSLELLHHTQPTVIVYCISRLAYFVQSLFRTTKYITLVNLLAAGGLEEDGLAPQSAAPEEAMFPEYLTYQDRSAPIAAHIVRWLTDPASRESLVHKLAALRDQVGDPGASARGAEYILGATLAPLPISGGVLQS